MKEQLFGFQKDISNGLKPNLVNFWRIFNDFSNIVEDINDENLAHILLHNLSNSNLEVKICLNYGRYYISLDIVVSYLRMRELLFKT